MGERNETSSIRLKLILVVVLSTGLMIAALLSLSAMDHENPTRASHNVVTIAVIVVPLLLCVLGLLGFQILRLGRALQSKAAAETATSLAKSDFLAIMSHEIRTPMTSILGLADMLADRDLPREESENCVRTIRRNGQHLLTVINEILDISKLDAGKMTPELLSVPTRELLEDVLVLSHKRAVENDTELTLNCPDILPSRLYTDPTRLKQVLVNLCGNAIKFTRHGTVVMRAYVEGREGDEPQFVICIEDSGIGMTEEQLGTIFKPFAQADSSVARKFGGAGLGLSISQSLTEMMGGVLEAKSEVGVGTEMYVKFPLSHIARFDEFAILRTTEDPGDALATAVPTTKLVDRPIQVLLAEDGRDDQVLISRILTNAGIEVTIVENGQLALESALGAAQRSEQFDVILMDLLMPVLDGYGAAGQLRQAGYKGAIVAMTVDAEAGGKARCVEAGCDDFTTKPINRKVLVDLIGKFVRRESTDSAES